MQRQVCTPIFLMVCKATISGFAEKNFTEAADSKSLEKISDWSYGVLTAFLKNFTTTVQLVLRNHVLHVKIVSIAFNP